jgi:hypothetical protein
MKKIALFLVALSSAFSFAQDEQVIKKNEIKLNGIYLLAGMPEFSYERLLNEESAVGIAFSFALDKDFENRLALTPFYRFYFGEKYAAGFFAEGFGMLNIYKPEGYYYDSSSQNNYDSSSYADFAVGLGLGGKWITKRGVLFEINAGFGRNLFNSDRNDYFGNTFVGRGGISVGYRF